MNVLADKRSRPTAYRNQAIYTPAAVDARATILIGAALADLRETVYRQQCMIEALLIALTERGLVDDAQLHEHAQALYQVIEPAADQ